MAMRTRMAGAFRADPSVVPHEQVMSSDHATSDHATSDRATSDRATVDLLAMPHEQAFLDKAVEGAVLFALNQGEVCTCQSRLLVQEDIYERFMERVVATGSYDRSARIWDLDSGDMRLTVQTEAAVHSVAIRVERYGS